MAKKKTISKIALVTESLRSQNQQISDLQKDVSELENIALLILEKVRRMEKYPVVQTKKGKLIPAKVGPGKSATLQPANDPTIGDTEKNTANDILMKIYNFMVKNAEKQKKEKDLEKNFEQENKQEKQRRYEKVVKDVGLDPSKLKKRGFLSTAGKLVKGTFWAGLGLALTGLVYLFRDEIKEFGEKILKGIEDIGNLITSVVDFVKGGYEKIMNFLQPMVNWIKNNPLTKYIKEQVDSMGQQGSSILTTVMNAIKAVADDIWDKITQWFAKIADTIMAFVNSPTLFKDVTNFILNHKAMLGAMAASMIPGPTAFVGGKVLGALAAHEAIAGAGAEPSPYHSAKREVYKKGYSDKFYQQTMDILNRFDDSKLKELLFYKNSPLDYLNYTYTDYENGNVIRVDRVKLANDFIDDPKLMSILVSNSAEKKDVLKKDIDTRDEQFISTAQEQLKNDFPEKNYEMKPNGIGGFMISENGNIIADSMKTPIEFFRLRTKSIASRALQETFNTIVKKVEDSDAYKATKSTIQEGGEKLEQAQEEFQSATANFTSSARQTYSEVTSSPNPTQKASEIISEKASQGISATKSLFDDKVIPSLEKIDTGAFMEEAKNQYLKFSSLMSDLNDPEKRNEIGAKLQEFAQNPIEKIKEIGQDPAEDPFNLNAIFEQQRQASINNNVINTGSTTTGIEDYSAIPVRNLYSPFRNSNILSTVNP